MKKVFIVFLVSAYLNCYIGCVAKKQEITVSYPDLDKSTNDFPLQVMTIDSTKYYFDADMYRFLGDTLDGIANVNGEPTRIKLGSSQIVWVNTEKVIAGAHLTVVGGIIIGVILVAWLVEDLRH